MYTIHQPITCAVRHQGCLVEFTSSLGNIGGFFEIKYLTDVAGLPDLANRM